MLPSYLSCLSILCSLWLLAQSVVADVVTLNEEVISVNSAHNVFVNGVEVVTGKTTPTSTLSGRFNRSGTATASGYPTSSTSSGVTDSTRGHISGISDDVRSQFSPASTGEPARFTPSSKRIDSRPSSDRFNVQNTGFRAGNSPDTVEAFLSNLTRHKSTIDTSSQHSAPGSSETLSVTSIGIVYSLGHGDRRTSSPGFNKVPSQFSTTRTRSSATLTQDQHETSIIGKVTARADTNSITRTSDGDIFDTASRSPRSNTPARLRGSLR